MGIYTAAVQKLYVAYFNRPADALGLNYWESVVTAAGGSTTAVSAAFAASPEYAATYAGMSTAARVDAIYQNLFGRSAEPEGLKFWGLAIDQGKYTVANAVTAIAAGAQGTDLVAYNNKVTAATAFTVALDTSAEIVAYSGTAANAAAKTWLTGITTDASLTAATATTALNASVAGVVVAGAPVVVAPAPVAFTTGADTINGTSGNDVFNASEIAGVAAWTVGDKLDGGLGADVLNVTQTAAITAPVGATVTGVETINLTSGTTGNSLNASSFTGLTALNVSGVTAQTITAAATTAIAVTGSTTTGATTINGGSTVSFTGTGAAGGTIDIGATTAATGAVTVKSTSNGAGGTTGNVIGVTGGTTVDVTQVIGSTLNATTTAGAVTVTGGASTTSVTVSDTAAVTASGTKAGRVNGAVTVNDANAASGTAAGTIASVSLSSFAAAAIDSSALTSVSLAGTGTSVTIGRGALTAVPTANTLAVNLNGLTLTGTLLDNEAPADDGFVTINVNSTGAASTINDLQVADATTINVAGDKAVTFTGNTVVTSLTAINVTSTGGASFGTALAAGVAFTGGAGADTISIGTTTKAITLGAGDDKVTTSSAAVGSGGSVAAGEGIDTIVMTSALAAGADDNATFNTKFTGFEVLELSNALAAATTLNLAGINSVSQVTLTAGGANAADSIIDNLVSGGTVKQTGDGTGFLVQVTNALFNAADVLNLNLSKTGGVLAAGSVTAAGVETININVADASTASTGSAAVIHTLSLTDTAATTVRVTGNNGLTLTNVAGNTAITTFDASGVVANGTAGADTAANLAVSFTSLNVTTTATVAITGGAGDDTLVGAAAKDTIVGGAGNDLINGGAGIDTLTGGTGSDVFTMATAAANRDTITDFTVGTGGDAFVLSAAQTTAGTAAAAAPVVTNSTTAAGAGGGAYALTGATTAVTDVIVLQSGTALASGVNGGDLSASTNGTELLKALTNSDAADAYTGITTVAASQTAYFVAYQGGNAYLYIGVDTSANSLIAADEISLIGTFSNVAANGFTAANYAVLVA